jgi:hypothetical protein
MLPPSKKSKSNRHVMPLSKIENVVIYAALTRGTKLFSSEDWNMFLPKEENPESNSLRMSTIGSCARKLWLLLHEPKMMAAVERPKETDFLRPLHLGSILEEYTTRLFELGGLPVLDSQKELSDFKGIISGHIDGTTEINGVRYLLEIKALKNESVANLVVFGLEKANPFYYDQMQYYMFSGNLESGYFVAIDKDTTQFYVELIPANLTHQKLLRQKVLMMNIDFVEKIPEKFIVRDCQWCPAVVFCEGIDGEEEFNKKYVEFQSRKKGL